MNRNYKINHRGFTILELMISMSIVVLLLATVYAAFDAGSKACTAGGERAQSFHTARLAMQDILRTIENVEYGKTNYLSFVEREDDGLMGTVVSDILEFTTISKPAKIDGRWHTGIARVRYGIANRDGTNVLEKWVTHVEDEYFEEAYVLELSENISDMSFRYFDDEEEDFVESWDSELDEKLPEMVEVTLYIQEGEFSQPLRALVMIPDMKVKKPTSSSSSRGDPQRNVEGRSSSGAARELTNREGSRRRRTEGDGTSRGSRGTERGGGTSRGSGGNTRQGPKS